MFDDGDLEPSLVDTDPTGPLGGRTAHRFNVADIRDSELSGLAAGDVPLSAVIAATLGTAGLADDPVPGWRTRSRWSALVPAISARVGNSQSWREVVDPTVNRAMSYDVRASWRLDRLIFDPSEVRFAAFDITRRRERRRLTAVASHLYLAWADAIARGAVIQARQRQADLDALTDGWFSDALAKSARSR